MVNPTYNTHKKEIKMTLSYHFLFIRLKKDLELQCNLLVSLQGNILLRDIYIWKFGISTITTYIFDLAIVFLGIYFFEWWQKYKRCMCKLFHYSILLRAIDNPNYTYKKMSWLWHWLDKLCYIHKWESYISVKSNEEYF